MIDILNVIWKRYLIYVSTAIYPWNNWGKPFIYANILNTRWPSTDLLRRVAWWKFYRCFGGTCCRHHQGDYGRSKRFETLCSTILHGATTQNTAAFILPTQENLKFYIKSNTSPLKMELVCSSETMSTLRCYPEHRSICVQPYINHRSCIKFKIVTVVSVSVTWFLFTVERTSSSATVNEVVMTGNINGGSTTGNAVITPLRHHRLFSANPAQQPILPRQATAATAVCSGTDGNHRTATSVKLWLFKGMVQVSRTRIQLRISNEISMKDAVGNMLLWGIVLENII